MRTGWPSHYVTSAEPYPFTPDALLAAVRAEIETPNPDWEDDRMRGHVLLDDFMVEHHLAYNRVEDGLDPEADEERSRPNCGPFCGRDCGCWPR